MIDAIKTKEKFNIDINTLQSHNAVKIVWFCDQCGIEKIKRYNEAIRGIGLCKGCHSKKMGKFMGDTFGKAQTKTAYYCKDCNAFLTYSIRVKYCETCLSKRMSERMSGSNNPAWTGKNVCECGGKKSTGAKRCRECSFKSGERSGSSNGRWKKDRNSFKVAKIVRTVLQNTITCLGRKKNNKTVKLLGYDFKTFRTHIETQFEPWMNWSNHGHGGWHVDHIIPITVLIDNKVTDPSVINALWNLRPLKESINIQRSNKIDDDAKNLAHQKLSLIL